jgi:competence protein ComEC
MPFEAMALTFDLVGAGTPFWWIVEQSLAILLWLAHNVSDLPGAVTMRPEMPIWGFGMMVFGGLWFAIWITRIRLLGLLPVSAGLLSLLAAPTPDLLVTGDGKNLAITHSSGKLALLRAGVGDYIRDNLMEAAGTKSEPTAIENWPGSECSADICVIRIRAGQRDWDILATRTPNRVPSMELAAACRRVDIVISDRFLPYSCKPRWQKFDRRYLSESGGLAIYLNRPRIESVRARISGAPWYPQPPEHSAKAQQPFKP